MLYAPVKGSTALTATIFMSKTVSKKKHHDDHHDDHHDVDDITKSIENMWFS